VAEVSRPKGDNTSRETIALGAPSPDRPPPVLWSVELGEGHTGAAVANGRVYVLDYAEVLQSDALRCFCLDDGREVWRRWYRVPLKRNHGVSRTVPAVSGCYVVTIGPACQFMCCDALTRSYRWGVDLVDRYKAVMPRWYTGQCPLIDGRQAVVAVRGSRQSSRI
jgi:outer membrane protein assembly factor BamB